MLPDALSSSTCRLCGCVHQPVALAAGETARCARCNSPLAKARHGNEHAPAAFALAGLIFAAPAALLPFMTLEKLGNERSGNFLSGVTSLHENGMPVLSFWVLVCGGLAPVLLLVATLASVHYQKPVPGWTRVLAPWAMPEVYVLAMLVALTRLGQIVQVELNAGFWSYAAMSLALLAAWRALRLRLPESSEP
jgi:paraquat-inducible protein A